jgi:hypothetical protein
MSKVTKQQIEEWKKKHSGVYELQSNGKTAYIFDPTSDIRIMKLLLTAMQRGSLDLVDALLANCWLAGDDEIKTDKYKIGLVDQVRDLVDIPEAEVVYTEGKATIHIDDKPVLEVRLATRLDIKYAEDRNKTAKPLDTQIHLLERLALDAKALDELRKDKRLYLGCLLAINEVKEKEYVSVKKL